MSYQTGEIYYVDLDPAKGTEQKKKRPCVIVSNANYNQYFNTVIVVPISSSKKFLTEPRFLESPLFIQLNDNHGVHGTILTQHLRAIDPSVRLTNTPIDHLTVSELSQVNQALINFFSPK
ncbi:type II toxin-antitoxin system PemK/MazF family toxin [Lactiplantibacillus daowaiensis]|uniref:Type II toxin-antitoxin system PemK/MazF family toxin n=1 Tax=Lactiplantibacillus daowaiensis TaxID=2559918 RepID=A0ABW1S2Y0_9LACO|nr:type II toxin-antitoxin system PemK/MazF family toxin [Lactiplantibacillus daowaiensis]